MPLRPVATLATILTTVAACPLLAQQLPYDTGQYQYAQSSGTPDGDDVVTEQVDPSAPRPAERVIPMRRQAGDTVFVSAPVIQGAVRPTAVTPAAVPAPGMPVYRGAGPVYYAVPGQIVHRDGGASRVILRDGSVPTAIQTPPPGYVAVPPGLPAGSQIVQFDREGWLYSCRARLAGYEPEDRAEVLARLGGAAFGYSPGKDECESYLDSYIASASAGMLAPSYAYGQSYMLVPVTVLIDDPRK